MCFSVISLRVVGDDELGGHSLEHHRRDHDRHENHGKNLDKKHYVTLLDGLKLFSCGWCDERKGVSNKSWRDRRGQGLRRSGGG
jgi:hypothetical protein